MNTDLLHEFGGVLDDDFSILFKTRGGDEVHCVEDSRIKAKKLFLVRLDILSVEIVEFIHTSYNFRTFLLQFLK